MVTKQLSLQEFELIEYIFAGFGASIEGGLTCCFSPVDRFLIDKNFFSIFLISYMAKSYLPHTVYQLLQETYPNKLKSYSDILVPEKEFLASNFKNTMFINCKLDDVLEFIAHYVKKLTKHFTKASANELPYEVWEPLLGLCNELHDYFDTFNDKQTQTLNSLIEQLQTIKANAYSAETIADYLEQEGSQSTEEVVGLGETFNMALYLYNRNFQKKPNQRTANQRRQIKAPSSLKY